MATRIAQPNASRLRRPRQVRDREAGLRRSEVRTRYIGNPGRDVSDKSRDTNMGLPQAAGLK